MHLLEDAKATRHLQMAVRFDAYEAGTKSLTVMVVRTAVRQETRGAV